VVRAKLASTMTTPTIRSASGMPFDFSAALPDEPLGLSLAARAPSLSFEGATAHRFEVSSRGDRVPGRLVLPDPRSGPCPVILAFGAADGCLSSDFDFLAGLIGDDFAVATIDLPLYGERRSAKFSERLISAISRAESASELDPNAIALLTEFMRQAVRDVTRTVEALSTLSAVDESRIAILGLGDGASVATIAASIDSHVNAAVLAFAQPMDIDELDARTFANAIAPRPILAIEAANGPSIFDACAEPKVRHNATGAGPALDGESEKVALDFFRQHVARS
jgi:dienelactone hydrolase